MFLGVFQSDLQTLIRVVALPKKKKKLEYFKISSHE